MKLKQVIWNLAIFNFLKNLVVSLCVFFCQLYLPLSQWRWFGMIHFLNGICEQAMIFFFFFDSFDFWFFLKCRHPFLFLAGFVLLGPLAVASMKVKRLHYVHWLLQLVMFPFFTKILFFFLRCLLLLCVLVGLCRFNWWLLCHLEFERIVWEASFLDSK